MLNLVKEYFLIKLKAMMWEFEKRTFDGICVVCGACRA